MINDSYKSYLMSFIYEEIEKNYFNALHNKNKEKIKYYTKFLNELENKQIRNPEFIKILKNMKDSYTIIDLSFFIDELLSDRYHNNSNINIKK
jgi:hypothetical protein